MITCFLKGGLGNIMFQVASATSLAVDNNDTATFPNAIDQLHFLNNENKACPNLKHALEYNTIFKGFKFIQEGMSSVEKIFVCPFHYIPIPYYPYLQIDGFFQSEKYFIHNRDHILTMFEPEDLILDLINQKYSKQLNQNCVSLHVRRGEYLQLQQYHPVLPKDYYEKSINYITERVDNPIFLIISDDPQWCKDNFQLSNTVIIDQNRDYIDLFLISQCKHNIIANSTFSWWGAWLNKNPNKIVIGPSQWFGPAYSSWNTNDVIPESWIKF